MEDQVVNHVETQSSDYAKASSDTEEKRYHLTLDKNGKKYVFSVPDGTPLGVAYDSCAEILYALSGMIQEATKKLVPQPKDEAVVASQPIEASADAEAMADKEVVNQAN